jgi:hypothetical protein
VQDNPVWNKILHQYQAGININFQNPDPHSICQFLEANTFYQQIPIEDVLWLTEEVKLLHYLKTIINS